MEDGQLPSSLEEVEALIAQLYRPGASDKVFKTQETLQRLQRSPEGWQLANALLGHKDEQVRFFAALTFIVKLNTDAKSLTEDDAEVLLQTLISWLIQCIETSEGALVLRKLCSTLVAYFLQFSTAWTRCIKHIIYCLCLNKALPYSSLDEAPEIGVLVENVPAPQAKAIFWFASTLVEEVGKTDSNSMKQNDFHRRVHPNVDDIVSLISKYIVHRTDSSGDTIRSEALKCYQAWVSYSHRSFIDNGGELEPLRILIQPALQCIMEPNLYETTVELFTEILSNYSRFLQPEDFSSLHALFNHPWAQGRYSNLIGGDFDFDSLQFGMFILAFGDATVQDLTKNIDNPQCQQYLSILSGLLAAEGYAVYEDKIYVPALEFWSTFVETMVDEIYTLEDDTPSWFPAAQKQVIQVVERCWRKSQFPPAKEFKSWDSVDQSAFKDARRDFSDLIQQFYLTTGIPLLQFWITQIPTSAASKNWLELEASLFCLAQLNDCVFPAPERDNYLDQVFTEPLLSLFRDPQQEIFTRTRKAFLDLVIGYADYFAKRPTKLPQVLEFSFFALSSSNLVHAASRSIMKLCSDCRKILLPELNGFLQHYSNIASNTILDGDVKESVMEGIASLIQAMDNEASKVAPLEQLLSYIEVDVQNCLNIASMQPSQTIQDAATSHEVVAKDLGIVALKCLLGVARGIQVPDDKPVDLDKQEPTVPFWSAGEGSRVQQRIYNIISQVYDTLGHQGDIVEEACHIWRTGLRELEPGPFVMPPTTVAQFMTKATLQTPRLGRVINTAASLISSKWTTEPEKVLGPLVSWVAQLLHNLGDPSQDAEISQAGIEFIQRLLPRYPQILMAHQPPSSLEFIFMFALQALKGTEPLPKAAAAEFWSSFISLPAQSASLQPAIDNAVQLLGPLLAQALIYNVGGHAARSELDKLSDPIKKLAIRQVRAKQWFENALLDPSFPSDKVNNKDKAVFLQKIINLRGAKGTNQVVREFWLACRGSNFAYAS